MALREINLIPSNILDRKEIRRHLIFWSVCLGVLLSPVSGFYVYKTGVVSAQKSTTNNIVDINRRLNGQMARSKQIKQELNALSQKEADLKTVLKPAVYSEILYRLTETMDGLTWLQTLNIQRQKKPTESIQLRVIGYAASNGALGNFIERLSSDPGIDGVVLKYAKEHSAQKTTKTDTKPQSLMAFEIECTISRG
jgi:Tfp pilus assembly protein PilN